MQRAETDRVTFEVIDRVALITVNDPDRRNAVTDEISAGLRAAVQRADADPRVHAVAVTGAGTAFCAGADLGALGNAAEGELPRLYDGFLAVADCTLPTVAAVNGPAVGAGLNLALACDVRIAGPKALFEARFQKLGIHPGGGAVRHALRRAGRGPARAGAGRRRRPGGGRTRAGGRSRGRPPGRGGRDEGHDAHDRQPGRDRQ